MIDSLVLNNIDISGIDNYATIIGLNPSQGARSPKLWNAVYEAKNKNIRMLPLDVEQQNLYKLLDALEADSKFIGSAVAAPYKEKVCAWLQDRLSPEAAQIGAVNCIYRQKDGRLCGTNTDGEGALRSFIQTFSQPVGKKILLLGTGGAAKAVAAYFETQLGAKGILWICGRETRGSAFADQVNVKWIAWKDINSVLKEVDIIINCTSIGFNDQEDQSPLTQEQLGLVNKHVNLFDIIYQPLETELIKQAKSVGLASMNGLSMNLEQAVIAFQYVNPGFADSRFIRDTMENV